MSTISSFCRITGHARNLPKPCYFPLLPPISPADAKKLCRITGRATDSHHYSPIIAFGKPFRFDGLEGCRITQHENLTFVRPTFIKTKDNEKAIDALNEILNVKRKKVDSTKSFVYRIPDQTSGIVLPPELEEAIRTGEIETLSVSKDGGHINIKLRQGRLVKINLEAVPPDDLSATKDNFFYGEGQSKEVLQEQQKIVNERNERKQSTMARKKLFEQKELKAEHDEKQATERPKSKRPIVKFNPQKKKEKMDNMEKIIGENVKNKAIIMPKFDAADSNLADEQIWYEKMLEDIASAQKTSVNVMTCITANIDWNEVSKAESGNFDWSAFPNADDIAPVEIEVKQDVTESLGTQDMEIAAVVETIIPAPPVDEALLQAISDIKQDSLKTTDNLPDVIKKMGSANLVPFVDQISEVVSQKDLEQGYLVQTKEKGATFVKKGDYIQGKELAISGAMIMLENEPKFVTGQIIHLAQQETFVAGQTIETTQGKRFVPGQTVVGRNGHIKFIPGHCVSNEEGDHMFVGGQMVDSKDKGKRFMPGQMVNRGDNNPVYMSGQTVMTAEGPKFVPGETIINEFGEEEFVPGIKLPTSHGEKFVPGQTFSGKDGLAFKPGQIVNTGEGPSFVPGTTMVTPQGEKKFVRGDMVKSEDGKVKFDKKLCIPTIVEDLVIPNEELNIVTIKGKGIVGFAVKPSNTANVQAGEKLYGDIVENETAVLFYLEGKLPKEIAADAKIISGELHVEEVSQRFIPGKKLNTSTGEKFIPGQMVRTNHGEEFVPGQIVETSEGPKFVPGQIVMTSEGEKFVPGQVIMEEDGPRFVPGQIIHTKNGATFIPGQMMNTDEGQKFVPGQLVETKDGPRFVPGQVVETPEGPKFVPGTVVETEEGLKYVPNNSEDNEEDSEISFQGFDVSPEELQLITSNLLETRAHSPITKQQSLIDSDTLKKLAVDSMVIHGRTPEPYAEKKKKKKRGKVTIDALDEENEEEEVEQVDPGRNKVEVLSHLLKADSALSTIRRDRELAKVAELTNSEGEHENNHDAEIAALKFLLSVSAKESDLISMFIGDDEQLISDILSAIENVEDLERNDQVKAAVKDTLRDVVTKKCDKQISNLIDKLIENPENLFTDPQIQLLLTEAVGIVCVTGDVELASFLEKFISEPSNPECLRDDKDVLAVLRQLLVLHRIAERDPEVEKILQELQSDPEGVKDRNKVRKLIRKAKTFLKKEKPKVSNKTSFDIRHVASSKDIPVEVFQQLKEDKKEAEKFIQQLPDELFHAIMGDDRCGGKFLESLDSKKAHGAQKELEKFKKGMAIVVTKESMQAVIPRHYARSVCYGIMPYVLIDEEGFKFFERGLTGRKLAPSRVIENTWFQPQSIFPQRVMDPEMQYNLIFLGDSYQRKKNPSLQYTCLLPSSGPTRISYSDSQRRASRDEALNPLRRSVTPSRRFSSSSLHEPYSRKSSITNGTYKMPRCTTPTELAIDLSEYAVSNYVSPYLAMEVTDEAPIARSGTVGKLLDKYSKFSLDKEFGYHNPVGPYTKYITGSSRQLEDDVDLDENGAGDDNDHLPLTYSGRLPTTYDKSDSEDDSTKLGYRKYQRPFSDIYEADEAGSPLSEKTSPYQSSYLNSANKKYNKYLNSDSDNDEKVTQKYKPKSSYLYNNGTESSNNYVEKPSSEKRFDSGNKISDEDDDMTYRPSRYLSGNKYGSTPLHHINDEDDDDMTYRPSRYLSGNKYGPTSLHHINDDDDDDDITNYKSPYLRNNKAVSLSQSKVDDDDEDDPMTYKPSPYLKNKKLGSSLSKSGGVDSDDDDMEAYRPSAYLRRTTPGSGTSYGNNELESTGKKYKSQTRKASRFKDSPTAIEKAEDEEASHPVKKRNYGGSRSDTFSLGNRFGKVDSNEDPTGGRRKTLGDPSSSLTGSKPGLGESYGYQGVEEGMYAPSRPYGNPMGTYGGGYNMPSYGGQAYGAPYMNQPSYMAPSLPYGGYGPSYNYGAPMGPYGAPMMRSYGGAGTYGLPHRRMTSNLPRLDSDDDDDDIEIYNPKKEQRSLASEIAKKYSLDREQE